MRDGGRKLKGRGSGWEGTKWASLKGAGGRRSREGSHFVKEGKLRKFRSRGTNTKGACWYGERLWNTSAALIGE